VLSATLIFTYQQDNANKAQHDNDLKIAEANRQNDLKIADDQQQEAALKAYLDDMTTLLLDKKLGSQAVADKVASAQAAIIARAKTLTVLSRLSDPQRKATVVQFLYEAHLIGYLSSDTTPIQIPSAIDLRGVDLSGVILSGTYLRFIDLRGANLRGADLSDANLRCAKVTQAQLNTTKSLQGAILLNVGCYNASKLATLQ